MLVTQLTVLRSCRVQHTLVKVILVLLALLAAASCAVQLIANATEKATARLLLARRRALGGLLAGLLVVVIAGAGELVDEIHCAGNGSSTLVGRWKSVMCELIVAGKVVER